MTSTLTRTENRLAYLEPSRILADPSQPRQTHDETAFRELVADIQAKGILQPLSVIELAPDKYRILAGSRRLAAAKELKLSAVPCLINSCFLYNKRDAVRQKIIKQNALTE
jgi:ParB/RepB/Spo0J family partition protein